MPFSHEWTNHEFCITQMRCCLFLLLQSSQSKKEASEMSSKKDPSKASSSSSTPSGAVGPPAVMRKRRTRVPDKPNYPLNLWSIMKNCIGKDLSKIPLPVSKKSKSLHATNFYGLKSKHGLCN